MNKHAKTEFETLLNTDKFALIRAAEDVYQFRFKSRSANIYFLKGTYRNVLIDVGLASNYHDIEHGLRHIGVEPAEIDLVILTHEHLDHIGGAHFFNANSVLAAHRMAAKKIELRDDFAMLRKMFNEPNEPIHVDIWLEDGNVIDLGNFKLRVMYTPGHTSACISLFDQDTGLLFAADALMAGGIMGGIFGSGSISDYIGSLEKFRGLDAKMLLSGHGRISTAPAQDVAIAIARSKALLADTGALFDALDARENFEPLMQSVRDLNKLDDG